MSILERIRDLFRKTELDSAVSIYEDEPSVFTPGPKVRAAGLKYDPLAVDEDVCYFGPGPRPADPPCPLPPPGWSCTLPAGHDGPCPAWAVCPGCGHAIGDPRGTVSDGGYRWHIHCAPDDLLRTEEDHFP